MSALLYQGAATPGYDPVRQTISELGTGWQGTRIVSLYGLLVLACVWPPISKRLGRSAATTALIAALIVVGIGCLGLGVVDAESGSWNSMTWRGQLHLIFAFGFIFAGIPVACLTASRALPRDWRGLRTYSSITGVFCLLLFVVAVVALSGSSPNDFLTANLGLIERVYVFAFMIWQCIVSASVVRFPSVAR
jgi:hypothetical membrane protein